MGVRTPYRLDPTLADVHRSGRIEEVTPMRKLSLTSIAVIAGLVACCPISAHAAGLKDAFASYIGKTYSGIVVTTRIVDKFYVSPQGTVMVEQWITGQHDPGGQLEENGTRQMEPGHDEFPGKIRADNSYPDLGYFLFQPLPDGTLRVKLESTRYSAKWSIFRPVAK